MQWIRNNPIYGAMAVLQKRMLFKYTMMSDEIIFNEVMLPIIMQIKAIYIR